MELSDYTYELPPERIAANPLDKRDNSNLLAYNSGNISHHTFTELPSYFSGADTIFFNNTRVIPARIHFLRKTGALIEIFLLEPVTPYSEMAKAMNVTGQTTWKCLVGNMKKWKDDEILETSVGDLSVSARIKERSGGLIEFSWNENVPFSELVAEIGKIPLPPYIKREVNDSDKERYQTVYNEASGAVAAPTAGLHFTDSILEQLTRDRGVKTDFLTLHVSAGTFLPIKDDNIDKHQMHSEQIYVTRENIETILNSERVTAVGTTSMRTLETLYWYGVKLLDNDEFKIDQHFPYQHEESELPDRKTAIKRIAEMMDSKNLSAIRGDTSIFIYPGYNFRMCDRLITNFHLPGSTLILLVAAFIGDDWKRVYEEALRYNYRFLSYGDSSLLIPR